MDVPALSSPAGNWFLDGMSSPRASRPTATETLRERTPWVELVRCRHCGRYWHVATDTVDDDVYVEPLTAEAAHLVLTENRWPRTFDHLAHVGLDRAR